MKISNSKKLRNMWRCNKRRKREDLCLESGKKDSMAYLRAVVEKTVVKMGLHVDPIAEVGQEHVTDEKGNYLYDKDANPIMRKITPRIQWARSESKLELAKLYKDVEFDSLQTKLEMYKESALKVERFLCYEDREVLVNAPNAEVDAFGLVQVTERPDYYVRGEKMFTRTHIDAKGKMVRVLEREPYIEAVWLSCGKPWLTKTGKRKDGAVGTALEMYTHMRYIAENLLTPSDTDVNLIASDYFLRRNDDKGDGVTTMTFDASGGGNIVSLTCHYNTSFSPELTELDNNYKPQFEEFVKGEDACEDCTNECPLYASCHMTLPPLENKEEKKEKALGTVILSDAQKEILSIRKGVHAVYAGAGSGKTFILVLWLAYLLDEGVDPKDILLMTYTNKAAAELKSRVKPILEDFGCEADVENINICTFHGFGDAILKGSYKDFGFTKKPELIEPKQKKRMALKLIRESEKVNPDGSVTPAVRGMSFKNFYPGEGFVASAIEKIVEAFDICKEKGLGRGDEDVLRSFYKYTLKDPAGYTDLLMLYEQYEQQMMNENLIDFADQERIVAEVMYKDPYYFEDKGYKYVVVDEAQDCNKIQWEMLASMKASPMCECLLTVGDDAQSIYRFRGSTPRLFVDLDETLGCEVEKHFLLDNFRCTPQVLTFANGIMANARNAVKKELVAKRPDGVPVTSEQFFKKADEFDWIAERFKKEYEEGRPLEDMCFQYPKRSGLLEVGTRLTRMGISWHLDVPEPVLDNSRVLAGIALAEFAKEPGNTKAAFEYINAVSKNTLLEKNDEEIMQLIGTLKDTLFKISLLEPKQAQAAFKEMMLRADDDDEVFQTFVSSLHFDFDTFEECLDDITDTKVFGRDQKVRRERGCTGIKLITPHSDKGLEQSFVIVSVTDYESKGLSLEDLEEKRRLFYVAATRAKDVLIVTGQSIAYGDKLHRTYSRFLKEAFALTGKTFSTANPYDKPEKAKAGKKKTA